MQNQKSKITYWVNGETVTEQEFINLTGEYFKYFEGSDVKAVDYSSVESLFDGDYKSQRQINEHLREVLGESKTVGNSTRHKYTGKGSFHKESSDPYTHTLTFDKDNIVKSEFNKESDFKDDVITSSSRGEKEMMEKFKEITIPFNNGSEQMKVRVCSPQCFCDGGCKKEIKEPFSIQVFKPSPFNQSKSEQEILDTFKRNIDRIEGVKETEGKLNYELDWQFIQQLAERMSQNKGKYEPYNWTKPMDVEKLKQSLFRHVIEVMKGNYSDDGREFGHWESIALNVMMINYQLKNNK